MLVLGEPKNWAGDGTTVGALVFSFLPKTYFWECFLDTLGDALKNRWKRFAVLGMAPAC